MSALDLDDTALSLDGVTRVDRRQPCPSPSDLTPTDLQTDNSQTTLRKNRSPYQNPPITVPLGGPPVARHSADLLASTAT